MEMLKEMAIFAQVVDSGGFSAAARHLGITTSAVSRHVSRLEAHLGGRLLLRTTRALSMTELGEQVHTACVRMLSTAREVHAMAGSYSARPNGVIRVSAPVVFGQTWLAPRLPGFLDAYPEVDVRLTLVDRTVDLAEDGIDLAIRIARELAPGLAARPLCAMRYVLIASPDYLARHGAPAAPGDLPSHRCCYLGYGRFGGEWTLTRGAERLGVTIPARLTINNSAAIVGMVEAGGGIGLVPDFAARDALAAGRVRQVLPDWEFDEPYTGSVHAVYTPGRHVALKVRALIDYLVQN
ncbi:LysR family transcriptional regulator [Duganella sp. CT11-25]|uniref:LysR family transcriptional regulator n=1 Tax=unclassified Duganella TaxID=2636909 RepID=UPI0039AECD11